MPNRQKNEKSPYLLQHKDNPVDWYPWGKEAFEKAKRENKPIFLSIGYSTCHWCHVMEKESFEDEEIAALLQGFVCIKVDREERPDIDAVYMSVCQALTGSGGWPLTILMTPEQAPFFAGTYLPRKGYDGQPGLTELLEKTALLWKNDRERLCDAGLKITKAVFKKEKNDLASPRRAMTNDAFLLLKKRYDRIWGGFGEPPKFPTPHSLMFLMRYYENGGDAEALDIVQHTLFSMACGGIFDQIGGGFSRYATDEKWLIPHFEKMLYDNALLIPAYLEAYQLTGKESYAEIAGRTADYILRELKNPDGGFFCGQDADSEGEEGKYYLFTRQEIIDILGREKGTEFCRRYHITEKGNFAGGNIPNRIGEGNHLSWADNEELKHLREYRKKRIQLHRDEKILLSWNAWTVIALIRAGKILNRKEYTEAAVDAYHFIQKNMTDQYNRLYLRFCGGEAANSGQLDDYAVCALALLELYNATFDIQYLEQAIIRARQMTELFEDKENGGYFMTADDAEKLIARTKELYDGAIPSGNSVAAEVLVRLAALTGENEWRTRADKQLRYITGRIHEYPAGYCFSLLAFFGALFPHRELIICSEQLPEELIGYLRTHTADDLVILHKTSVNQDLLSEIAPFTASYPIPENGAQFYLCENGACKKPAGTFAELNLNK